MYTTVATLLALATSIHAKAPSKERTFAVNYFYGSEPLLEGRYDPIVTPGTMGTHVHTIMGGNAFNMTMGDETALEATCTNSLAKADKSNYWWPKLYFQDPNDGSFEDVHINYAKIYYFSEPTDDEIKAFPPGLRMTTGQQTKRSAPSSSDLTIDHNDGEINSVQFMCSTLDKNTKVFAKPESSDNFRGSGFPDAECDQTATPLRYDLHFPSCYNPEVDVKDHKNNMDFPTKGNCPEGWTHLPHVFMEVYWDTPKFASRWTPGQGKNPWVLSQGDPTGYGLHGDFLAGWDEQALQNLIDGCNAGNAGFNECPNIMENGGVNTRDGECVLERFEDEKITGKLEKLPGCNPITEGPEDAVPEKGGECGGDGSEAPESSESNSGSGSDSSSHPAAVPDSTTPTTLARYPQSTKETPAPASSEDEPAEQESTGQQQAAIVKDSNGNIHTVHATQVVHEKVYITAAPRPRFARRHLHAGKHGREGVVG